MSTDAYSTNKREWMRVGTFPYYNRIGRMMYDADGRCTHCQHHARDHGRTCRYQGRWDGHRYVDGCGCWMESPQEDAYSAGAAAMWNNYLGRDL